MCLIKPYNRHFLQLHDTVLYLQFYCTYLFICLISGYNIFKALSKQEVPIFCCDAWFLHAFFWICISCLFQKKICKNRASQQKFCRSYFSIALVRLRVWFFSDSIWIESIVCHTFGSISGTIYHKLLLTMVWEPRGAHLHFQVSIFLSKHAS